MLIIFNMPERKISDEVFKSCNHVEYRWVMLASCSYPESKKADTRSISMNVYVHMSVFVSHSLAIRGDATTDHSSKCKTYEMKNINIKKSRKNLPY